MILLSLFAGSRQQAAGTHKPYDMNKQPRERTHENEKRIKRIVVVVVFFFKKKEKTKKRKTIKQKDKGGKNLISDLEVDDPVLLEDLDSKREARIQVLSKLNFAKIAFT